MNQTLTIREIKAMFSAATYKRGLSYFNQGRIYSLESDANKQLWRAQVSGTDIYNVNIRMTVNGIQDTCDCPAYVKYWECKHICAVLLKIADSQTERRGVVGQTVVVKRKVNQNLIGSQHRINLLSYWPIKAITIKKQIPQLTGSRCR